MSVDRRMDGWRHRETRTDLMNRGLSPCKRDAADYVSEHGFLRTCATVSQNISVFLDFDSPVERHVTRKRDAREKLHAMRILKDFENSIQMRRLTKEELPSLRRFMQLCRFAKISRKFSQSHVTCRMSSTVYLAQSIFYSACSCA